eukprot:7741327-Alexandrium_andersonii.AAC.1
MCGCGTRSVELAQTDWRALRARATVRHAGAQNSTPAYASHARVRRRARRFRCGGLRVLAPVRTFPWG